MKKHEATTIATQYSIPLGENFHGLSSIIVEKIIDAANARKYREPKNANGSRARYFYAMLTRANNATVPEYVVQVHTGYGWEDETTEETRLAARLQLKAYRENTSGHYRVITRRIPA